MKEILERLASKIQDPSKLEQRFKYIEREHISPDVFKKTSYYQNEGFLSYILIREYPEAEIIFKEDFTIYYPMTIEEARVLLREKMLQSLVNYAVLSSMHFMEKFKDDKTRSS